ncbi:MAG: hypothetical protein HC915_04075, partial [Anaerolineae bacterium]|nr:hypothetical protein [Anaerolineae bacterium]
TFKYSYQFDGQGAELTVIDDLEDGAVKTYKDELLLTSMAKETSVLSSYSYSSGKVSEVKVTRLGRPIHVYSYAYAAGSTIVTDETGVVRTYGANKKLARLDLRLIIPVGKLAIALFFDARLPLQALIGQVGHHQGAAVVPLPHPSGASTWHMQPANQALIAQAIEHLRQVRQQEQL